MNAKTKKLINELNMLEKKHEEEFAKTHDYSKISEYEKRLMSLTQDEIELLSAVYFESDEAARHISAWKACY